MLENIRNVNSPTNGPTETQLGWSHPIMSPTCPPRCGCHGNGRCLATAHWTFCSYGRLEAERVNQIWWNLVQNSMFGPQWQSRDQILKFLKFKIGGQPYVGQYWKYHNSPSNGPVGTKLGIPSRSGHVRPNAVAMATPLPSNGALNNQQLWASLGRTREPIFTKFGIQQQIRTTWQSGDQILKFLNFKMADGRCWKVFDMPYLAWKWTDWDATWVGAFHYVPNIGNAIAPLTMGPIGTTLGWSRPSNTSAAKPFPWYWSLLLTAQWTF